jgi:hypothetical protein
MADNFYGGYQYPFQDYTKTLGAIGSNLGEWNKDRRVGNALGGLPPEASWQERAQAVMNLDPEMGVEMLRYGDTFDVARERNAIAAAGRQQANDLRQRAADDKTKKANRGALAFAKQATDLANYTDNVAKMPGLDAATGSYKPTGDPKKDKYFQYVPADLIPNKPGGDAANFEAAKKTLKAKIGFTELQAMRNASATGGALGQVAVQEIDFLQNSIAALDSAQDPATFRESMKAISTHYRNLAKIMSDPNWGAESVDDAGGAMDIPGDPSQLEVGKQYRAPNGTIGTWTGEGFEVE